MMTAAHLVVAIDGPAASGKGTLARRLAATLNLVHLDSGKLYRRVALTVLDGGGDPTDPAAAVAAAAGMDLSALDDPALSRDEVGNAASQVAAIPAVRDALIDLQRRFAGEPPAGMGGAVIDGRDIGTVICPDADYKFFVVANTKVRATRRHNELLARGEASIYAEVLADINARDRRDRTRAVSPLKPSVDAVVIDSSAVDADAVLEIAQATVGPDKHGRRREFLAMVRRAKQL